MAKQTLLQLLDMPYDEWPDMIGDVRRLDTEYAEEFKLRMICLAGACGMKPNDELDCTWDDDVTTATTGEPT